MSDIIDQAVQSALTHYEKIHALPEDFPGKSFLLERAGYQAQFVMINSMILSSKETMDSFEDYSVNEVDISGVAVSAVDDEWTFKHDGFAVTARVNSGPEHESLENVHSCFIDGAPAYESYRAVLEKIKVMYDLVC